MDSKIKKDVAIDPAIEERIDHMEVYRAANLLAIAADLCMLYDMYEMNGMDASNLDKAVELLKEVVVAEMSDADEGSEDAQTAKRLAETLEAFQKRKEKKTTEEKVDDPKVVLAQKRQAFEEVKSMFKSDVWVNGYFAQQREILG